MATEAKVEIAIKNIPVETFIISHNGERLGEVAVFYVPTASPTSYR
jgi:hypothetical protein